MLTLTDLVNRFIAAQFLNWELILVTLESYFVLFETLYEIWTQGYEHLLQKNSSCIGRPFELHQNANSWTKIEFRLQPFREVVSCCWLFPILWYGEICGDKMAQWFRLQVPVILQWNQQSNNPRISCQILPMEQRFHIWFPVVNQSEINATLGELIGYMN